MRRATLRRLPKRRTVLRRLTREVALHMSAKPILQSEPFCVSSVVHLFKAVVALVVTPVDENGLMIDTGAILAPSFETGMGGW